MKFTHTPGPWEWVGHDLESNFPGHYESVIESTVSCGSFCYGGSVDMKISDADRRLIAAAPDLLEALKRCKFDSLNMTLDDLKFCRAAVAKATGG